MSPQNNENVETAKVEAESAVELGLESVVANESVPSEVVEAFTGKKDKEKKRIAKGLKVSLFVVGWLILMCGVVGLAFLLRPKVEIGAAEESFKWSEAEKEEVELVDVDFYSLYDTNAIEFYYPYEYKYDAVTGENSNPDYDSKLGNVPQIKGLKNEDVQNKINSRIIEVARSMDVPENRSLSVIKGDNMFNVLSLMLSTYLYEGGNSYHTYVGLNFDLTTGNELTFNDIFVKGANIESIVFKRFYNTLSSGYSFDLLGVERGIKGKESGACIMWCNPDVSLEEYYVQKEEIENKLANVEEIALNKTKEYLAGEKKFYLESAGPMFIYNDGSALTEYYAPDDVQYFAYLGKYRMNESIYEDDSIGLKNMFLSSVNTGNFKFGWVEENDKYFIDFLTFASQDEKEKTLAVVKDLVEEVLGNSDQSKYHYILTDTYISKPSDRIFWIVNREFTRAYEMDKEYYDKVFRKAIFEGKTHRAGVAEPSNPLPKKDMYDESLVTIKDLSDYGITRYAFMDENGNMYDTVEDIFIDGVKTRCAIAVDGVCRGGDHVTEKDWKEFLISYYYQNAFRWENGYQSLIFYTDEEKENHEFRFRIDSEAIEVDIKDGDGDFQYGKRVGLDEIPNEYLKEVFRRYN